MKHFKSHLVVILCLVHFIKADLLVPSSWAHADIIECTPKTDGSPYCQPKAYVIYSLFRHLRRVPNPVVTFSNKNKVVSQHLIKIQKHLKSPFHRSKIINNLEMNIQL